MPTVKSHFYSLLGNSLYKHNSRHPSIWQCHDGVKKGGKKKKKIQVTFQAITIITTNKKLLSSFKATLIHTMSCSKLYKDVLSASCNEWIAVKGKRTEKQEFLQKMVNKIQQISEKKTIRKSPPLQLLAISR